ncbi:MAG TPA: hypothetical protein VKP30_07100 [Polyangiaceae bacterium]|nr:hypothetical protein [Polyangiaceae bacterium]
MGFDEWFAQTVERDVDLRFQSIEAAAEALNALSGVRLVGPRAATESVPNAVARSMRVEPNTPSRGEGGSVKPSVSADTVNPSSVTSRGIAKIALKPATVGLLLAGFSAAGVMLAYWLLPASNPVTAERMTELSTRHGEGGPSGAQPVAATPAVSLAEAASAGVQPAPVAPAVSVAQPASAGAKPAVVPVDEAASTLAKPAVVPIDAARGIPKPATTKPKDLAPAPAAVTLQAAKPQAVKPPVAKPQVMKPSAPATPRTKPFTGGF